MLVPRVTVIFLVFYVPSMIFSVTVRAVNVNVFPDFEPIENKTAGMPVYQTDSENVLILKPGRFRLLDDGVVIVEPLNSTQDEHYIELWSNSSFFCDARERGRNLCGVRWTLTVTSHTIAYTAVLLGLFFIAALGNSVATCFYGTGLGNFVIFSLNLIVLVVNVFAGIEKCDPYGRTLDVYVHLFALSFYFWMSSIAVDSLSNYRHLNRSFAGSMPLRGNLHVFVATLSTRLMLIEFGSGFCEVGVIPETQLWNSVEKCRMPYLALYRYYTPIVVVYSIGNLCNLVVFVLSFSYFERRAFGEDRRLLIFIFVTTFIFSALMIIIWLFSSSTIILDLPEMFILLFSIKTSLFIMFIGALYFKIVYTRMLEGIDHND